MLLFIVSFLLVFTTSYLITSVISPRKSIVGFIYLFITAFAQLVLTFEILSLFNSIKEFWVLLMNIAFLVPAIFVWNRKSRPIWSLEYTDFRARVINALRLDMSLMVLLAGFWVLVLSAVILCFLMPVTNDDAAAYHVARSAFWVVNGNLNHFNIGDIRNLCLPINSEILYSWVLLFVKKDVFLGFFSFVGYLLSIVSMYNILKYLGFCLRKILWVIFILSSFASVIVQISGTETDIIIAGLVSSSMFLYWYALKNKAVTPIFMSALAYALALGTKTPSIMAIPGVGLFLLGLSIHYRKKDFFKPLGAFVGFVALNFVIFSSYNYVLNYIHFGDMFGSASFMHVSKNYYGIKGMVSNFIKYFFLFFDFTGLKWADYVSKSILGFRDNILFFLHLGGVQDGIYTSNFGLNRTLLEPLIGAGVLGFSVFLPCVFWSFIRPWFSLEDKKPKLILAFGALFIINLLVLSYLLAFMAFSVRFIMFFMVISSPVLVYSYFGNKNPVKYVIVLFAMFNLVGVSTNLWARPLGKIFHHLYKHPSIRYIRMVSECKDYQETPTYSSNGCVLNAFIKLKFSTENKFLFFNGQTKDNFSVKKLAFDGYKIDFGTMEDLPKTDLSNYDYIISPQAGQKATYVKYYNERKNEVRYVDGKLMYSNDVLVPCVYFSNPNLPESQYLEGGSPYIVHCKIRDEFLEKNQLKVIAMTGVIDRRDPTSTYYIIYKNMAKNK